MNSTVHTLPEKESLDHDTDQKLCSLCGLCMASAWPAEESIAGCVFTTGWLGKQEANLFGQERSQVDYDEILFGISRERFIARITNPLPNVQFSGIITSMAKKAFEAGLVDAVLTVHRSTDDYMLPEPVLARSTEAILAGAGSKPVLAPSLISLEKAYREGFKKLLVIGTSCQVQNLREFKRRFPYLKDLDLYVIGIPCTDNCYPQKFRWVLEQISHSPQTVRFIEFMQDFTIHLKHDNGELEQVPFFCLPEQLARGEIHPPSCRSCFDYMNSLADITVGYLGAPLNIEKPYQWVLVRTEKGQELMNTIADQLEIFPETSEGDRTASVQQYVQQFLTQLTPEGETDKGSRIPLSLDEGRELADYIYSVGPKGLEFARYGIETHLIQNYYFVKFYYPELLSRLVPNHTYNILDTYELEH
jgi:coenzyme F420 hydrogenase subunit beta